MTLVVADGQGQEGAHHAAAIDDVAVEQQGGVGDLHLLAVAVLLNRRPARGPRRRPPAPQGKERFSLAALRPALPQDAAARQSTTGAPVSTATPDV